jgi:hypothetical protein
MCLYKPHAAGEHIKSSFQGRLPVGSQQQSLELLHEVEFDKKPASSLPRQRDDFCCFNYVVKCEALPPILRFEYALDLEVVAIA